MLSNIFDTHAHYTNPEFDEDRDTLLEQLPEKGVKYVLLASSDVESTLFGQEISGRYDYIYTSAGVHPEYANDAPDGWLKVIEKATEFEKNVAIGEIGLDYHYEGYDKDAQIKMFESQLELAKSKDLPVIIHSRDATADCMEILRKHRPRGVMHCFSGSPETAKEVLAIGMYISFTGVLTFKNAKKAVESLEVIPMDRLLLETDCPYMAPVPYRGTRCDSSMITSIAQKASEIKGVPPQEILDITCDNAKRLFLKNKYRNAV